MIEFIVHDDPVGRAESNYLAHVDLAPFGLDGQKEQLWLKPLNDGTFSIACIPFCTYGLALGDRVALSDDDEVAEVVALSWHRVLRLLLVPGPAPTELAQAVDRIKREIRTAGLLSEWSGDRHVAVDIPPHTDASRLFEIMEHEVTEDRAFWEWADTMPFSARR
ncbi:DUF4265 domain-containing protein [Kitasatospora sp. NPDC057015]|uniref:DUF4265 domain-containing protein n=1 Tax=Kitasatospora sp. NPDC057015 TaxID=3346001 RepID=UPI003624B3E4